MIDSTPLGGVTFPEACQLFNSSSSPNELNGMVECRVRVARRRPDREGPLSDEEHHALVELVLESASANPVGQPLLQLLEPGEDSILALRPSPMVLWTALASDMQSELEALPHDDWARLTERRLLPRPAVGCRCGSREHERVNDHSCQLYASIRPPTEPLTESSTQIGASGASNFLSVVKAAYVQKFQRVQSTLKDDDAEAQFVLRMEERQLKVHQKAIVAPSRAMMVLSAVAEVQFEDNDSDDIPLSELSSNRLSRPYLSKLVEYICGRWGHVFREPSHLEHGWYVVPAR